MVYEPAFAGWCRSPSARSPSWCGSTFRRPRSNGSRRPGDFAGDSRNRVIAALGSRLERRARRKLRDTAPSSPPAAVAPPRSAIAGERSDRSAGAEVRARRRAVSVAVGAATAALDPTARRRGAEPVAPPAAATATARRRTRRLRVAAGDAAPPAGRSRRLPGPLLRLRRRYSVSPQSPGSRRARARKTMALAAPAQIAAPIPSVAGGSPLAASIARPTAARCGERSRPASGDADRRRGAVADVC